MKTFLALNPKPPRDRSEAWGFLTANLALPGSGSLAAGRKVGYLQMACALGGVVLTMVGGIPFIFWALRNWSALRNDDDPLAALDRAQEVWVHARGALLGMAIFFLALLWALSTSRSVLASCPKSPLPPKLRGQ